MHLFGVVVWLGGLMFQNAVAMPVVEHESGQARTAMRKVNRRFVAFVWMSAWTILVTGVIMMLLSPKFVWFSFTGQWSVFLLAKVVVFAAMVLYAFGYARMLSHLDAPASNGGYDEHAQMYVFRVGQFRKISIFLGITALLLAAAMEIYG